MRRVLSEKLQPYTLPPAVVLTITLVFAVLSISRGVDWAFMREPGTVPAMLSGDAFGIRVWGALLLVGGLALIGSLLARRHFAVWASHSFLFATYIGIGLTTLRTVVEYGGGLAILAPVLGGVVWHGLLSWWVKPIPRRTTSDPREGHLGRRPAR